MSRQKAAVGASADNLRDELQVPIRFKTGIGISDLCLPDAIWHSFHSKNQRKRPDA
jgi:hypothetical protein